MDKNGLDFVVEKSKELMSASTCSSADKALEVAAHAREIKAAGAKYCDCPACAAVEAILDKKDILLGQK